VRDLGSY
jgi:hypothetical protein